MDTKAVSAVVVTAAAMGIAIYLVNQRQIGRLQLEKQTLMALQESTANERDAALSAAKRAEDELERHRKDQAELLRLRGEVAQLRRLLDTQKPTANPALARRQTTEPAPAPPGAYIPKEQLAHVGYATPEAVLQTMTWAMIHGTYDQVNEAVSPEMLAHALRDPKEREEFEVRKSALAPLFKGFQIVAKKQLADDKVELKIRMDADPIPGQQHATPAFLIQRVQRFGDAWRISGSTRAHRQAWETDGQIQTFVP